MEKNLKKIDGNILPPLIENGKFPGISTFSLSSQFEGNILIATLYSFRMPISFAHNLNGKMEWMRIENRKIVSVSQMNAIQSFQNNRANFPISCGIHKLPANHCWSNGRFVNQSTQRRQIELEADKIRVPTPNSSVPQSDINGLLVLSIRF